MWEFERYIHSTQTPCTLSSAFEARVLVSCPDHTSHDENSLVNQVEFFWTYYRNVIRTNEIAMLLIITQHRFYSQAAMREATRLLTSLALILTR